jgi:dipeptidase E
LNLDVAYIGGGNTAHMLTVWKKTGLDEILKEAWNQGVILAGVSAGSMCWFEEGITDSIPGTLTVLKGLGFLPGSNCVHYDGEKDRRPTYRKFIATGQIQDGLAADDGAALHYKGTELFKIVSSRPHAKAYRLARQREKATETTLKTLYLGS